jgi:hypothetical protein
MELMQANKQWSSRPADERFVSLTDMLTHFRGVRENSREIIVPSKRIEVIPAEDNKGLTVVGPNGHAYAPTNWSFGQLSSLAGAPAGYLRTLASPLAADCINYGLQVVREVEDVGCLLHKNGGAPSLSAATGPRYGRIWNEGVLGKVVDQFGNGIDGDFRVPGIFGEQVEVTKENTTLYAGDRDMFIFLADERHRIELPNRRGGKSGSFARGFFLWNSEVGARTFGIGTFLFDYVCFNRIVWGAQDYAEITIRHSASAPDKWIDSVVPALNHYANSSGTGIVKAIEDARSKKIGDVDVFLKSRNFTVAKMAAIKNAHLADEGRPIETVWDAVTGITAHARDIKFQDERVSLEREAGKLMTF